MHKTQDDMIIPRVNRDILRGHIARTLAKHEIPQQHLLVDALAIATINALFDSAGIHTAAAND